MILRNPFIFNSKCKFIVIITSWAEYSDTKATLPVFKGTQVVLGNVLPVSKFVKHNEKGMVWNKYMDH